MGAKASFLSAISRNGFFAQNRQCKQENADIRHSMNHIVSLLTGRSCVVHYVLESV